MDSISNFVSEHGIEALLDEISSVMDGTKKFHEVPEDTSIDLDEWFEFGWAMNNLHGRRYDIFTIPTFNYVRVEEFAKEYITENQPLSYGELTNAVANEVDSISQSEAARYLEFGEYEENEDREIVALIEDFS